MKEETKIDMLCEVRIMAFGESKIRQPMPMRVGCFSYKGV